MERARLRLLGAVFAAAWLLAACGGGGSDAPPRVPISRVVVAGDSLADVGTFGAKFTVQNSADPAAGFPIFPEIVARDFGIERQCNFFRFNGQTFVQNPTPGCTNFAIGGGRIVVSAAQGGAANPQTIGTQLATAVQVAGGTWGPTDLILVDGGGNDAADLVGAFIGAQTGGAAGAAAFQAFLAQQIDPATLAATLAQPNGAVLAGGLYLQKLADTYYTVIKTNTLDKGATHVTVLDMPDITLTPRFRDVLGQVAVANGGGAAGAAAAAQLQAIIRQWITGFNTELRARIGSDTRVALVPFFADFTEEVTNPAIHGLTNVTDRACGVIGVPDFGNPAPCTSAALDASPPPGLAPGWWQTWTFSDGFHPTPFGHRLLAASTARAIARAGWL
jgi:phospholipase/lecithinase/hemolysin